MRKLLSYIFNFKEYRWKKLSFTLLFMVYAIGFLGVYLINILQDADENLAQRQIKGLVAGLALIAILTIVDYHFIAMMFVPLYIINMALLLICRFSNSLPIY